MFCAVLSAFFVLSVFALIPERRDDPDKGFSSAELLKEENVSSLETAVTYTDSAGKPTVAVDKGYAILIKTKNSSGKTEKELYFDAENKPKKRSGGYYGISYAYNGNETLIAYLDEKGKMTRTSSGYAAIRRMTDGEDRAVYDFYLDEKLEPVECSGGYYGIYNEYGEDKRVASVTYLGADGEPVIIKSGYAKKTNLRDESGNVIRECYFGLSGEKAVAASGQHGESYIRDENNRIATVTYLDENLDPSPGSRGYSVVKRTYHKDGTVDTQMYFDLSGEKVRLSKGQYGTKNENGVSLLLDKNGRVMLSVDNLLNGFPYAVAIIGAVLSVAVLFLPKKAAAVLTCLYTVFILYETLMFRETVWLKTNFELFSYIGEFFEKARVRAEVVDNVWLFVPFGAGICRFFGAKRSVLYSLVFSCAIESTQYITSLGTAELNDIFGNTLGGALGALSAVAFRFDRPKERKTK